MGKIKNWGWVSYFLAGSIWYFSAPFKNTPINEFVVMVISISAGALYYRLKAYLGVKNETTKAVLAFSILLFGSAAVIGFLTAILKRFL